MSAPTAHRKQAALTGSILALGLVTFSASAQQHPGAVGNVLAKNPYASPAGEGFGRGVNAGDFDGNGISDLAISESSGERLRVLLGRAFDVDPNPLIPFYPGTVQTPFHQDEMISGDFDGDGRDEIAVADYYGTIGGLSQAGSVYVFDRASNGTWSLQGQIRAGDDYPGAAQAGGNFGNSLAAGDFNADGFGDLAIGIRGQIVGGFADAGAVMVVYGTSNGIGPVGARIFNRINDGLAFSPADTDRYGRALAAGDFDGDGDDDLAIGISNATCPNGSDRAGAVVVLNGIPSLGIRNTGSRIWRPGVLGLAGSCSAGARFGSALVAGHFAHTGLGATPYDDLAIGAPAVATNEDGAVYVLYGTSTGLEAANNQRLLAPATPGFTPGTSWFGNALATGKLARSCGPLTCDGDSLAVGAPLATINGVDNAGAVWIFDPGNNDRLDTVSARPILPLAPLSIAGPHTNDQFGNELAIGDFNDDGKDDLAIGAYLYDDGANADAGAVQVLYQSDFLFVDGFD